MNNSYSVIRAIRGPITLITLGVLFVLQNFTRFGFDQTWPVLLIVFGLLSLMQRGAAPPVPPPAMPVPPAPRPFTATGYAQSPYAQPTASAPPRAADPAQSGPSPSAGGSV